MQSLEFLRAWREKARTWQAEVPDPEKLPDTAVIESAFAAGEPLITLAAPAIPAGLFGAVLADLAGLLAQHRPGDSEAKALAAALRASALPDDLAGGLLAGSSELAEGWVEAHAVSANLLLTLAGLAFQPFMARFATAAAQAAPIPMWRRNYCPVCGTDPDVCRIDPDNLRWLHCPQCDTQWEHHRLTCVNCDTDDMKKVHILTLQDLEPWRVEVCDVCGGYTKTLDQRHGGHLAMPKVDLFLEDARTLQLDLIAEQEGYRKGGRAQ